MAEPTFGSVPQHGIPYSLSDRKADPDLIRHAGSGDNDQISRPPAGASGKNSLKVLGAAKRSRQRGACDLFDVGP
jgi:hypothetical protein